MSRRNSGVRTRAVLATSTVLTLLSFGLVFTRTAGAQTGTPRLGVGLSFLAAGKVGTGVAGGLVVPFRESGARSIGVVAAGALHHAGGVGSIVSFGGGVRVTHTLTPQLKAFFQGVFGIVQRRVSGEDVRTDLGFGGGGGVLIPMNDRINVMIEADAGAINDAIGDINKGLILTFGFSVPLGSQ